MPKKTNKQDKQDLFLEYLKELQEWQQTDLDQRQDSRDADRFVLDKDGQWEDSIRRQIDSQQRPRYTFDKVTPAIEAIMTDIEDMDFGSQIKPAGGGANKEVALTYEGMIRAIEANSKADKVYRDATRRIVRRGFDAWIVKAKYVDDWSFDQDLVVEKIPNAINRVWASPSCVEEDSSDTPSFYILTSLSPAKYKEMYPDGSGVSVSDADIDEHYDEYRPEVITIAERYYKKERMIEVALMSNGQVYEMDDKFESIKDELAQNLITVKRTKKVKDFQWCHIVFDGKEFLTEETETVFRTCPLVTVYGNFELLGQNNKITYSGIVQKAMDAQRVHNYAKSREIEEGALAPRKKILMTKEQAKGHTNQIARMNISADPVQFYNHVENQPLPYQLGGPEVNQHLSAISAAMQQDINAQTNVFSSMQGDFAARQSEDAIRMQIDRGVGATRKWVNAIINGIRRTSCILVETIPYIYDTAREFAIQNVDGSEEVVTLNQEVYDTQTQQMVKINDLNQGKYKVVCDAGPAFSNKLEAGVKSILDFAAIDPSIIELGGDVILKSIDAPLIDKLAERKRALMIQAGTIPFDQMTSEEQAKVQEAALMQAQQPDPAQQLAQAEAEARLMEGQAAIQNEINDANKILIDQQKADNETAKVQIEAAKAGVDIEEKQVRTQGLRIDNLSKVVQPLRQSPS